MRPASLEKGAEETTSALSMRRRTYTIALTMDIDNDDHAKVDGETARLVSSWLQDQLQCASVGGIASACGISRSAAALTLEHLLPQKSSKEGQHPTYRVTSVSTTSETLKWNNKKSASSSDAEISPREESIPCTGKRAEALDEKRIFISLKHSLNFHWLVVI
jgi:hypothetical protein